MKQFPDLAFNEAVRTMARKVWRLGYDISDEETDPARSDYRVWSGCEYEDYLLRVIRVWLKVCSTKFLT